MTYRVTAIKYGNQRYPGPAVFFFSRWFEWIYLDFYFWLVQGEGRTVLIDVGMSQEHADVANPYLHKFVGGEATINITRDPIDALADYGVAAQDVDHVILTHTHLDHICNVAKFPRATFVTSRRGFEWVTNPPFPSLISKVAIPEHAMRFLIDEAQPAGRLRLTEDREEVFPGLVTVRTGGHTFDHQIVLVDTEKGRVGLIVDNAPTYANLDTMVPIGSPFDVVAAMESLRLINEEADIVVPGHDPDVTTRFEHGRIA